VEVGFLALAGCATALATGAGAVPVFFLGEHADRLRPFLWGATVGLMGVASIVGLLLPAIAEDGGGSVAAGTCLGAGFLLVYSAAPLRAPRASARARHSQAAQAQQALYSGDAASADEHLKPLIGRACSCGKSPNRIGAIPGCHRRAARRS
jgi:hypothetical protein